MKMMSPTDLRFFGQLQHGVYSDEVCPSPGDIAQITADAQWNVRHEPVSVPRHSSPFHSPETMQAFLDCLHMVLQQGMVLEGMGLEGQWDEVSDVQFGALALFSGAKCYVP
ncbi:hypothetical protein BOTBODRAFT_179985 [Botryobasidium botryosum FD-172 SS1]|uniref:Uncharacterized protein n=1 Tax=Botryobasidium botryosum (strain FD-172 SS1) TaxID=930990 RepID=A0A067LYQ1_BOTB1|nr:hypothetical protein BOTBODRAFT_179985 [Botryobasidium botryosum FD-172 SS1]